MVLDPISIDGVTLDEQPLIRRRRDGHAGGSGYANG
jgi:hypothetical protein